MYNAKIIMKNGNTLELGYDSGILFDLRDLSGINVDINTSQGFGQTGDTVTGISLHGAKRTIEGNALSADAAQRLIDTLQPGAYGKIVVNNYRIDFIVSKTPNVDKKKNGDRPFVCQIFCPIPFWQSAVDNTFNLGGFAPAFRFPVNYHTHKYGEKIGGYVNCKNAGSIKVPFILRITSIGTSGNFTIEEIQTGKKVKINTSISEGETLIYMLEDGKLKLLKQSIAGITDEFKHIDEATDLYYLQPGDNLLKMTAEAGDLQARATVTSPIYYSGVVIR